MLKANKLYQNTMCQDTYDVVKQCIFRLIKIGNGGDPIFAQFILFNFQISSLLQFYFCKKHK